MNYQSYRSRPDKPSLYAYLNIALELATEHTPPPRTNREDSPPKPEDSGPPSRPNKEDSPVTGTSKSAAGSGSGGDGGETSNYVDDSGWVVVTGNDKSLETLEYSLQ